MLPRVAFILIPLFTAAPASAHLGHLGEMAGHSHWVAGAALGRAGVIAVWAGTRGRRKAAGDDRDTDHAPEADPADGHEETAET